MASLKRLGFFWGEEKITVVEFEKNVLLKVVSSPLGSKASTSSSLNSANSGLSEEIQITAILQKILKDNKITGGPFYVSLPMKEIILRSFIIPFVQNEDIQNVIKFEAKKYMPFDIQDLSFVYCSIPYWENKTKRIQVIFFAVRKEVLAKYERIFKEVDAQVFWCEPYMVSLSKALLFRKEIKPTDHFAFLILDNNVGRICFIDKGIPQFIREFPITPSSKSEEDRDSAESLNFKIINEVGNSFDFYTRQFNADRITQMLISCENIHPSLLSQMETELKIKPTHFTPVVTAGVGDQNKDMDAIYAMGACVVSSLESLLEFNFIGDRTPKSKFKIEISAILRSYREIMYMFAMCVVVLIGVYVLFQVQLRAARQQYTQLTSKQGAFLNVPVEGIQSQVLENTDKLAAYKNIRTKSDVVFILLRVASHVPQGALLRQLDIRYDPNDSAGDPHMTVDMVGDVLKGESSDQIAVVSHIFADLKADKELAQYVKNVNLVSLNHKEANNQQSTGFNIHCF